MDGFPRSAEGDSRIIARLYLAPFGRRTDNDLFIRRRRQFMARKVTRREFERLIGRTMVGSAAVPLAANAIVPIAPGSDGSWAEDARPVERKEGDLKPWADVVARR